MKQSLNMTIVGQSIQSRSPTGLSQLKHIDIRHDFIRDVGKGKFRARSVKVTACRCVDEGFCVYECIVVSCTVVIFVPVTSFHTPTLTGISEEGACRLL